MAPEAQPLSGLHVLVTRPAGRATVLIAALERLGALVAARPTIAIEPPSDPTPAERVVTELSRFTWIAFTSAHGVRAFFDVLARAPGGAADLAPRLAAVGPATAQALREHGASVALIAAAARAAGLAVALGARIGTADRVLVVGPEERDDALERGLGEHGAAVEVCAFYRTVAAPGIADLARAVVAERFDVAVFTSPSTLDRLVDAGREAGVDLVRALSRMALVAIGPATARALAEHALSPAAIAERPSDDAVLAAVTRAASSGVLASPTRRREPRESPRVSSPSPCKRTPLHDEHVRAGARMVEFAGWHMPIQYAGVVDEHLAVRSRAGLFDVSHMGEVRVRGPQAVAFAQHVTSNDVTRLVPGRAHYTGLLTEGGGFVDDLLVYRLQADELLLVVNAANTAKDVAWLAQHARAFDVALEDESDRWSQLALQGPRAAEILARSCALDLPAIRYYQFLRAEVAGAPCIVSRTGYTGEDGFELYAPAEAGPHLWRALLESGAARWPRAGRSRCAGHAAARGQDGALRQRHRRHDDAVRGRPGLDRASGQGRVRRPRGARRAARARDRAQARGVRDDRQGDRASWLRRAARRA